MRAARLRDLTTRIDETWPVVAEEIVSLWSSIAARASWSDGTLLEPEVAHASLLAVARSLEEEVAATAGEFPFYLWLTTLRRLPDRLFGDTREEAVPLRALTEALAAGTELELREGQGVRFTPDHWIPDLLDRRFVVSLCRLVLLSWLLEHVLVCVRFAAKGASIGILSSPEIINRLPKPMPDNDLRLAASLFDRRLRNSTFATRLDWFSGYSDAHPDDVGGAPLLVLGALSDEDPDYELGARFSLSSLPSSFLENLAPLLRQTACLDPTTCAATLVFAASGPRIIASNENLASVLRLGYHLRGRQSVEAAIADTLGNRDFRRLIDVVFPGAIQSLTASDVVEAVDSLRWSLRPQLFPPSTSKPVTLVQSQPSVLIDWAAIGPTLDTLFPFERVEGKTANIRGRAFEEAVQSVICNSPLAPPDSMLQLRRRTLRIDGKAVTDIDAIGESQSTNDLILVSCKSMPYSNAYDRGDYALVRNVRTRVENAVEDWYQKMTSLRQRPIGDNYDFRSKGIVGIVCLPFVPFTAIGHATEEVLPGLRACVSISELTWWAQQPASQVFRIASEDFNAGVTKVEPIRLEDVNGKGL